jgi:Amt family ammonium transporter
LGAVVWVCFGYGIFAGDSEFAAGVGGTFLLNHNPADYSRIFQQFGFAATATTLVSGSVLGRCKFSVYLGFSMLLTGILYPIEAHWAWSTNGWLAKMGFLDFAGGAVVHVFGAFAAIAGAIGCGPRVGRFHEEGSKNDATSSVGGGSAGSKMSRSIAYLVTLLESFAQRYCRRCLPAIGILAGDSDYLRRVRELPAHSVVLYSLGGLFLWIGWFSFNASSAPNMYGDNSFVASLAAVNTLLASGSGTFFALGFCYFLKTKLDLGIVINSLLTSAVVITPAAGYVDIWVSLLAGPVSVVVFTLFRYVVLHACGIDDPLDVFAVHGAGGVVGMLTVGFLHKEHGLFYTGDARFLGVEMLGTLVIAAMGFLSSLCFFTVTNKLIGVTYSKDEQLAGLDFLHFELESQADIDWVNVQEYNVRERMKREKNARKASKQNIHNAAIQNSDVRVSVDAKRTTQDSAVVPTSSFT